MNVLILGGAGYLGCVLTKRLLDDGHAVTIVDNLLYDQGTSLAHLVHYPNYAFELADVTDLDAYRYHLETAHAVVHLAAIVGAPACDRHRDLATAVNADSVAAVVAALRPGQRFLLPNTNSGYGTVPDGLCTEETPLAPISHYGRTKLVAERHALTHPGSTVLRLATVFGVSPRMRLDLLVNQLVYDAHLRREVKIFDGGLHRNFVHVADVAAAMHWCLENDRTAGQVYNLGNDAANMTKLELGHLVARHTGANLIIGQGNDPDRRDYLVSSDKLARAGFRAERSLTDGIRELRSWYSLLPDGARHFQAIARMNTTCGHRPAADDDSFFNNLLVDGQKKVVHKGWGSELWFANTDLYCGKILIIDAGKKFSWHYHGVKDETFYVLSGGGLLYWGDSPDLASAKVRELKRNDSFRIRPGLKHRFHATVDTEIIEVSTTHLDSDSIRLEKGD